MRSILLVAAFMCVPVAASAQADARLIARHARIGELYEAKEYAAMVREIDAQIIASPGTSFADSLHRYLYKYGRAFRKLKDAKASTEAAERIYRLVKARGDASMELEALFDLSWVYYDAGDLKECARVDSMAVSVADGDMKVPLSQKGRARQYLAFDHSVMGDHRRSGFWAQEALAVYARADSIPAVQWAESYTAAGVAAWHLGRIREAEQYYLKALEVLGEPTDEAGLNRKVATYGNLGVLWQNAGDLARSRTYYQESLRICDRLIAMTTDQFTRDEAVVSRSRGYVNLATVYFDGGDVGRARELLDLAWNDRSSVLEADDPQLLAIQERYGDLELSKGSLDKARQLITAYHEQCQRKWGWRSEEVLRSNSKLAEIEMRSGDHSKADSLLASTIQWCGQARDGNTDAILAVTYQRRAHLHSMRGRHEEAIADLGRARTVLVAVNDSAHFKVAAIDVQLAEAAFQAKDPERALGHATAALAKLDDRVRALRSDRLPRAFPDPHILPDAYYWKVRSERALVSKGEVLSQWKSDLDLAMAALARNKTSVSDEGSKLLLIGAQKRLYDLALEIAYDAYVTSGSEADAERFLHVSEADRSTLLKGRLNEFAGLRFTGVPDTIIAREQELIAALEIDADDRRTLTEMAAREQEYAEFLKVLEKSHPAYFTLRYGEPVISLKELRKRLLTPDRQLISYAFAQDHLYVLVVGLNGATLQRVEAIGLNDEVGALNAAIVSRDVDAYTNLASTVYQRVLAPVSAKVNAKELLIIPDGPLHTVSFDALLMGPASPSTFPSKLLIQRHAIAYLLSATTAVQFAQLAREKADGMLALAPGFDDDLKRRYARQVNDSMQMDRDFLRFVRQPFAVSTAKDLGDVMQARVLLGGSASERGFRNEAADHGILHLGTHALMNATSPMYSRLVLSKDSAGADAEGDGYLHAYEIYELDLRAQLAVLTACETGTGKDDGEGVRSLGYGFAYAGCPSLVTSLWSIDEQISSAIIKRFYELLADGLPKHLAMRQAKLDHLASVEGELALPYYWAGLVLVGDVEPVRMPFSWTMPLFWSALVLLVLALGVWWYRRPRSAP
jgi:CHAT domain-containing protein